MYVSSEAMAAPRREAFVRHLETLPQLELSPALISVVVLACPVQHLCPVRRALVGLYLQETYPVCLGACLVERTWHAALLQAK